MSGNSVLIPFTHEQISETLKEGMLSYLELVIYELVNGERDLKAIYDLLSPTLREKVKFDLFSTTVKEMANKGILKLAEKSLVVVKGEKYEDAIFGSLRKEINNEFGVGALDFLACVNGVKTLGEIAKENILDEKFALRLLIFCIKNGILKTKVIK